MIAMRPGLFSDFLFLKYSWPSECAGLRAAMLDKLPPADFADDRGEMFAERGLVAAVLYRERLVLLALSEPGGNLPGVFADTVGRQLAMTWMLCSASS